MTATNKSNMHLDLSSVQNLPSQTSPQTPYLPSSTHQLKPFTNAKHGYDTPSTIHPQGLPVIDNDLKALTEGIQQGLQRKPKEMIVKMLDHPVGWKITLWSAGVAAFHQCSEGRSAGGKNDVNDDYKALKQLKITEGEILEMYRMLKDDKRFENVDVKFFDDDKDDWKSTYIRTKD